MRINFCHDEDGVTYLMIWNEFVQNNFIFSLDSIKQIGHLDLEKQKQEV